MNYPNKRKVVYPFLKWVGGKRWLFQKYPQLFTVPYDRYIEPFLGGGAIFFSLCPQRSLISDLNKELISTYQAIKTDWEKVYNRLEVHQTKHSKNYYYLIRAATYNDSYDRAAQFIYLNRTCWNGLYRVNKNGQFNVPIGTKENVVMSTDDFRAISDRLINCKLATQDFEKTINTAGKGDFLFIDPPYTVRHNNNNFRKYNEKIFSWDDQERLKNVLSKAKKRGANILICNADHPSILDLYLGFGKVYKISRHSVLAGKTKFRVPTTEAVITTY